MDDATETGRTVAARKGKQMALAVGSKLRVFGKAALRETIRLASIALLQARIAKIKLLDVNAAHRQLGQKSYDLNLIPDELASSRDALSQLQERIASKRRAIPAAANASVMQKVQVLGKNLAAKGMVAVLTLKLSRRFSELGIRLASTPTHSALLEPELDLLQRTGKRIEDLETRRRALSRNPVSENATGTTARAEMPAVSEQSTAAPVRNYKWVLLTVTVLAMALVTVLFLARPKADTSEHHAPVTNTREPTPAVSQVEKAPPTLFAPAAKKAQPLLDEGTAHYQAGNMERAFASFLDAAKLGHPGAQLQAGWHYEKGAGVKQDYQTAAGWYRKAADQGDGSAMKNLGQLYENGQGVPEDWKLAAEWYRKGADKNSMDAEAALGRAYQFGIGVPQDRSVSRYWNERAFAHGDESCERWVRWLRDPTNNIGFRNEDEHALVIGNQLRTSGLLLGGDPAGMLFRNSAERIAWLRGFRNAVDQDEAEMRRQTAEFDRQQAENSRNRHESEVRQLQSQGYSREAAERKAGW